MPLPMQELQEMQVWSLCWEDVLWRRKWQPTPVFLPGKSHGLSEELGRLWSVGSQGVRQIEPTIMHTPPFTKLAIKTNFILRIPFILIAAKNPSLPDHCHLFPYLCLTLVCLWSVLNSCLSMTSQFLSLYSLELPVHDHQNFLYPQALLCWFISSFFPHRNLAFPQEYCFLRSPHKKWNFYLSHPVYLGTNKWSWCLPCLLIFMDDCNFCLWKMYLSSDW